MDLITAMLTQVRHLLSDVATPAGVPPPLFTLLQVSSVETSDQMRERPCRSSCSCYAPVNAMTPSIMNCTARAARMMPSMRVLTARPVTPRIPEMRSAIRKLAKQANMTRAVTPKSPTAWSTWPSVLPARRIIAVMAHLAPLAVAQAMGQAEEQRAQQQWIRDDQQGRQG